ncbi:MAG: hypothetical protein VB092_08675 [Oscillospiraceae bacterium]|nr:hypothetical protein [Oscillospiraceae bacterium]
MGLKDIFSTKKTTTTKSIATEDETTAAAKAAAVKAAAEKAAAARTAAVKAAAEKAAAAKTAATAAAAAAKKSVDDIAKEVIRGNWGNGQERKDRLTAAGYDYSTVQTCVNAMLKNGTAGGQKSVEEIAREVIRGNWGNGQERKDRLTAAGYDYSTIQGKVNELLK